MTLPKPLIAVVSTAGCSVVLMLDGPLLLYAGNATLQTFAAVCKHPRKLRAG